MKYIFETENVPMYQNVFQGQENYSLLNFIQICYKLQTTKRISSNVTYVNVFSWIGIHGAHERERECFEIYLKKFIDLIYFFAV